MSSWENRVDNFIEDWKDFRAKLSGADDIDIGTGSGNAAGAAAATITTVEQIVVNEITSSRLAGTGLVVGVGLGLAGLLATAGTLVAINPDIKLEEEIVSTGLRPIFMTAVPNVVFNTIPDPRVWLEAISVGTPDIPNFDVSKISIVIPPPPLVTLPGAIPPVPTLEIPPPVDPISVAYPPEPILEWLTLPDVPNITLPVFDTLLTLEDLPDPVVSDIDPGQLVYGSPLMDATREQLFHSIVVQGTGINTEIEDALFNREHERAELARQEAQDNAASEWAEKGFSLPDGALAAALLNIETEYQNKRLDVSRDIMMKAWDLEQQNIHKSVEQAVIFENNLMNWTNEASKRTLEASKAAALAGIEVYKALVSRQQITIEAYKARVMVYEADIKKTMMVVDIYKTEVDAVKVATEINQVRADIYKTMVGIVELQVRVYQAELEARRISMEIEKARIDAFKAQVDAYIAEVNLATAQYVMYGEQCKAEKTKAEVYATEVDAYKTRVEAAKIEYSAEIERVNTLVELNKVYTQVYASQVELYKGKVAAESGRLDALVKEWGIHADIYKTNTAAYEAAARVDLGMISARIDQNKIEADIALKNADLYITSYVENNKLKIAAMDAMTRCASQLAASCMAGLSTSVNLSASGSMSGSVQDSWSNSWGHNVSQQYSQSLSQATQQSNSVINTRSNEETINHNYNHIIE